MCRDFIVWYLDAAYCSMNRACLISFAFLLSFLFYPLSTFHRETPDILSKKKKKLKAVRIFIGEKDFRRRRPLASARIVKTRRTRMKYRDAYEISNPIRGNSIAIRKRPSNESNNDDDHHVVSLSATFCRGAVLKFLAFERGENSISLVLVITPLLFYFQSSTFV